METRLPVWRIQAWSLARPGAGTFASKLAPTSGAATRAAIARDVGAARITAEATRPNQTPERPRFTAWFLSADSAPPRENAFQDNDARLRHVQEPSTPPNALHL